MSPQNPNNHTIDPIPEDLKPYYQGKTSAWQRWIGPVLRGLLLLVVIGLVVWGGIWAVNKLIHRNDNNKSTASTSQNSSNDKNKSGDNSSNSSNSTGSGQAPSPAPATPTTPPTPPASSSNPNPNPNSSAPAPSPTPTPGTSGSTASNGQLANTGPGEVIAAAFGVFVVATLGFYFFSAYRVSASKSATSVC